MSTSLLHNLFGVRGYRHRRIDYVDGAVIFSIVQPRERLRCSQCGSHEVIAQGSKERFLRTVPIGSSPAFVRLDVSRVLCGHCEITRQVDVPFADPRRSYTHSFERYVLDLSEHMTIQSVARHLDVSWDIVKDIQARHLAKTYSKPNLKRLKEIAIDEIHTGRGSGYLTLVLDLESGAVVYVGDGRGAASLTGFWKRLRGSKAKIRAVATDMSTAYVRAVREHLPKAVHVFDHFHVIKLYNEKLSDFRRDLYRELQDAGQRAILKGTRWLLLKNPENLDDGRNELERLADALSLNLPLTTAYYMKEDLRQIWRQPSKARARRALEDWIRRAERSGVQLLERFAETLRERSGGILAYYDFRISTGPLEGVNNKIKTMKRQAYGYRDLEFFKLKILGLHRTKYALVG